MDSWTECFRRSRGKWNGNGKGREGMSRAGVYQAPCLVGRGILFSLHLFFFLCSLVFSFFLFKITSIMETGSYVFFFEIQGLLLFSIFFTSAFTALFPFDSCIYTLISFFSLKPVWGVKKRLCLLISHFLSPSYPLPFRHSFYSYKNSIDHYISYEFPLPSAPFLSYPFHFPYNSLLRRLICLCFPEP